MAQMHRAYNLEGHSRGRLKLHVLVQPKFVNVPELFFRHKALLEEGSDSHVTNSGTALLFVPTIKLSSLLLDEVLHLLGPAQKLHQPFHAVNQVPQLDHIPAPRMPRQGPHQVPVDEQSGH